MHSIFLLLIAAVLTALGAQATPEAQPTKTCTNSSSIAVATPFTAPATEPTGPFQVYGYRQGYDVVHQFWNAEGQKFYLGGSPSTYCPSNIQNLTGCPPGDATVFSGLDELYVEVPGGQQVYVDITGYVGYTQAHSDFYPPGAFLGLFTYFQPSYEQYGYLSTDAFGAQGFMACPTPYGTYQIFAAFVNATVPLGNISACIGFDAVTAPYSGTGDAAWQYT